MSLTPITSATLASVRHGFFTRAGGVSRGHYAGLNCGLGSGDVRTDVQENRARVAATLGLDPEKLYSVHQIHSARVVTLDKASPERPKADAMVTATPGLGLGILTADCAPVLFADTKAGVIGAAHSGWKGALSGVLEATVQAMEELGASEIAAVVGPTISQANYEVGPEFVAQFQDQTADADRFFAKGNADRSFFDLPGYVLSRLEQSGINASWTGHCTYADPAQFFSYRRATHKRDPDYGRLIAGICL